MNEQKVIRWKQRFENLEKSYKLLSKYINKTELNELERAGIIQLFKIAFELSWKLIKDYLEAQQIIAKSPRDAIKAAYQINLIDDAHAWIDALNDRNLTVHTYDDKVADKMIKDITNRYFGQLSSLYEKLSKEI
jgi:nucleotidyltransferase substrate binding protein (TIGR01987 family)